VRDALHGSFSPAARMPGVVRDARLSPGTPMIGGVWEGEHIPTADQCHSRTSFDSSRDSDHGNAGEQLGLSRKKK
jgi:hypothetical protein